MKRRYWRVIRNLSGIGIEPLGIGENAEELQRAQHRENHGPKKSQQMQQAVTLNPNLARSQERPNQRFSERLFKVLGL